MPFPGARALASIVVLTLVACSDSPSGSNHDAGWDAGPDARCVITRTVYSGDGTAYTPGNAAIATACYGTLPKHGLLRAAMAPAEFAGSALCGACAEVTGDAGTAIVFLDDLCPGCAAGDLDMTEEALTAVGGASSGRFPIHWRLVPCTDVGPIQVDFQGSNPYYLKMRLSSHRNPVATVGMTVDAGILSAFDRTPDNFFEATGNGPYAFPMQIRATDALGQAVTFTVGTLVNDTLLDAGTQFEPACAP